MSKGPKISRREFARLLAVAGGACALLPRKSSAIPPGVFAGIAASRRRAAPASWDPDDYGTCILWLVGDSAPSGSITTWTADRGTGPTQATSGSRPTKVDSVINGHSVVRFDGTDDFLATTDITGLTFFVVLNAAVGINDYAHWFARNSTATYPWHGGQTTMVYSGASPINVVNGSGWVDGVSTAPASMARDATFRVYSFRPTTGTELGSYGWWNQASQGGRYWKGDFAEVIVYSDALSTGNRQSVEDHLGTTYGITITH